MSIQASHDRFPVTTVPESFGTTECEYSIVCSTQTNKVIHLMVGDIPICDYHIEFFLSH